MSATMRPTLGSRAVAVILAGMVATSISACGPGASSTSSGNGSGAASSGTPSIEATSSGAASPGAGPLRWSAVHLGVADGSVMSLASDGNLAVALISGTQRTIWSSGDGHAWKQDQALPADAYPNEVAGGSGGFLIVGQRDTGANTYVASTWTSPDGHAWTQSAAPNAEVPAEGVVIGPDDTAVLMGTCIGHSKQQQTEAVCGGTLRNGTWTAAASPSFANSVFGDLAVGPAGYLAVGQARGDRPSTGAVWTSVDGLTWDRTTPDSFASLLFWGAAVTATGMIAVGSTLPSASGIHPRAFRSTDGKTWTALPDVPDVIGSGTAGGLLRAAGELPDGRLVVAGVAVGATASGQQVAPMLLVLGSDGTWQVVPEAATPIPQTAASGDFELGSIVVLGNRVLVGGADADGAVIWVGEPAT